MTNKKIVIADDEPDILNLLSVVFRTKGYEVFSASDGQTAIDLIKANQPAAAVLDFMMPKLDGAAVARKARQYNPNMFIMLISGVGNDGLKKISEDALADEYLEKPLRMAVLLEKVKAGLDRVQSN